MSENDTFFLFLMLVIVFNCDRENHLVFFLTFCFTCAFLHERVPYTGTGIYQFIKVKSWPGVVFTVPLSTEVSVPKWRGL